ncbi:alpha/beta hydrolase family esterase [Rhizobium halophytocola]|uniref:Polyhydroxybutyrate depolymerase n=1 Tax=Rhizobium halophytocola TaxID=735519 RepID=A0ABS4DSM2_9HYPH|nr:polyhydroxybutyrate depolymerase [Rhizobium halophytocola]MBP1848694.1 polyhydroxybutyrate depolymerase [Rhizobium halophytocola]
MCGIVAAALALIGLSTVTAQAAGCGLKLEPGRHDLTIESHGVERHAVYFVPSSYDGKRKVPLVFDFHGSNSYPAGQLNRSHWDKVGEREGAMVIALQGSLTGSLKGMHAWNVPGVKPIKGIKAEGLDDIAFISDAVRYAKDNFCVDPNRIFASGYSGGGRMLSQYICSGNDAFAAAGFVVSLRAGMPEKEEDGHWRPRKASCHPVKAISIIAFSGLKDNVNPFAGGGGSYWQYGGEVAVKRWAEIDSCKSKPVVEAGEQVSVTSYAGCVDGARVTSYTIADSGHAWPSQRVRFQLAADGDQPIREVDATSRMWNFFRNSGTGGLMAGNTVDPSCPDGAVAGQGKACGKQPSAIATPVAIGPDDL